MDRWNGCGTANTWSIVLAGGRGRRLRSFTERLLGRYVPKQYCTFVGRRSMLQHTLDRARLISAPNRIVTVVAEEHRDLATHQITRGLSGRVLFQPADRDTAAGIFLPIARVLNECPDANIVIFPADHFVHPERLFADTVRAAVDATRVIPDKLVLLGVEPDCPEPDFGWIVPGRKLLNNDGYPIQAVHSFVEKPSAEVAKAVKARGGLWNTLIMSVRAKTLWELGRRYLPDVVDVLETWIKGGCEADNLSALYRTMPRQNFSSALLQRAERHVAVLELENVLWSDWGREERILETLDRIGARPTWAPMPVQRNVDAGTQLAIAGA